MQFAAAKELLREQGTLDIAAGGDFHRGVGREDRSAPLPEIDRGRILEIEQRILLIDVEMRAARIGEVADHVDDVGRQARAGEADVVVDEIAREHGAGHLEHDDAGVGAGVELAVDEGRSGRRGQVGKLRREIGRRIGVIAERVGQRGIVLAAAVIVDMRGRGVRIIQAAPCVEVERALELAEHVEGRRGRNIGAPAKEGRPV